MNAFIDIDMKPGILEIQFLIRFSLQVNWMYTKNGEKKIDADMNLYNQKVNA